MRLEDFEKSKSELNEKYRNNLYNGESTLEREWLLKVNDFENKIVRILGFSLFAYLVIFLCTLDAIEKVGITAIINILPTTILLPGLIQVSASLLVGAILNKIIEKIVKGTKDVLETIDATTIKATVDLSGLGEGEHSVKVVVTGDEVKASYVAKTTTIKVKISKS